MLRIDNDAFVVPSEDEYYTSGLRLERRKALDTASRFFSHFKSRNGRLQKVIHSIGIAHHFYTPFSITELEVERYDRPYAGWLYLINRFDLYYGERSQLTLHADAGVVGPAAFAKQLQTWWHGVLGFDRPVGWDNQIRNTPAVNLRLGYRHALVHSRGFELLSESSVTAGTIMTNARQGLTVRVGELKPISNSQYSQSKLGSGLGPNPIKFGNDDLFEIYVLYSIAAEFVLHNTLIDGNLIGKESPHTEQSRPWVYHRFYGLALSGRLFDLSLTAHRNSREAVEADAHAFLRIDLTVRY